MASLSESTSMSFRLDKNLKKEADALFKKLGLNTSVALNMFLTQSVREQSIPFTVTTEVPNSKLLEALEEGRKIMNGEIETKTYTDIKELIEDLDKDD